MNSYPISRPINLKQTTVAESNPHIYSVYISQVNSLSDDLQIIRSIFDGEKVWPDQCIYTIEALENIQKVTSRIVKLFNSKIQIPKSLRQNRYSILTNTYYFHDQIDRTMPLIRELSAINQKSSRRKSKIKEIRDSLHQLNMSFDDLMKRLSRTIENS